MNYRFPVENDSPLYSGYAQSRVSESELSGVLAKVYNLMAFGVFLTAMTAIYTASTPWLMQLIFGNRLFFYALIFGELGLVFAISSAARTMQKQTAMALFFLYSAVNGVTLASIFFVYTRTSIGGAFISAALMFAGMAVIGYTTKKDLTTMGGLMMSAVWGLIAASLINMFFPSQALYTAVSYIGVFVFLGLTAYDSQKIKLMAQENPEMLDKVSVLGALTLYLDFINLFLYMLRIFGDRRR